MSKLTTDVAKQYTLHGEAEALRGVMDCLGDISTGVGEYEDEGDIEDLRDSLREVVDQVDYLYCRLESRLKYIEELVKNSG